MLKKIYASHNKWINTVKKFGCTKQQAEDIVGEMYINIALMLKKGLDITYGDDVNYFYIYRALRNIYINFKHKQVKQNNISIDLVLDIESGEYVDFDAANDIVLKELDNVHWYDKKVFELLQGEYSITELSKKTNITYHSLYNTYRKTKQKLRDKIIEK
tara:strand:+ start:317 stop:793 length:477 start_codon:yes stop_codon:yes gene_type:complete